MSAECLVLVEKSWKEKTKRALELENKGEHLYALNTYTEALIRAEILQTNMWKCISKDIPFCECYANTCLSLANLYRQTGNFHKAKEVLRKATKTLAILMQKLPANIILYLNIDKLFKQIVQEESTQQTI